jgi:hypothetical protein
MKWKRQVFLVLTLALLAVGRPFQHASGISTEQGSRRTANVERPAVYVARALSVSAEGREAFVLCLRQKALPVWQRMRRDGLLADQSVFETASVRIATPGAPPWNFLLLSHLAPSATPDSFFDAEQKRDRKQPPGTHCEDVPGVQTRRVEVLHSTPNSYHPRLTPSPDAQAEFTVPYIVEYIAVRETPEALNEYRETMRTTMGPVLAEAIRDNMLLNFIALETVSVRYAQPGVPKWNQIHLRGYFPDKGLVTRDALDGVLRRINPQSGGAAGVSGRLDAIRTKPREDVARQLPELAVR